MPSGTKPVVVLLGVVVSEDGYPGPMMESIVEGLRARSPQEDLSMFAALFGDGSYTPEAPEGLEISAPNGVVGIAEHGSEHEGADARERGEDGGVGVGLVGCSLLLEPPFEELVGLASMLSNEEQLLEEEIEVSGSCFDGSWRDPERCFSEYFEDLLSLYSSDMMLVDKLLNGLQAKALGWMGIEKEL